MKNPKKPRAKNIRVKVVYLNDDLRQITGKAEEIINMPHGAVSGDFLDFLEKRYPQIFEKYGLGYLGFVLNGKCPKVLTPLKDNDCYEFTTWTKEEIIEDELARLIEKNAIIELPKGEMKMPEWMECSWRRISCGKNECPICGKIRKNREKWVERGEDPDDIKHVLEDVGQNFKEVLTMIKKDAKSMGIDITNIDDVEEPPEESEFPLYLEAEKWRKEVFKIAEDARISGSFWLLTEAAEDIFWYSNTILAKIYRQLCNRWHIENGDDYGEFDYKYTKYVLEECIKILKKSLTDLISATESQGETFNSLLLRLENLEKQILNI